jgi:hypothetical protein
MKERDWQRNEPWFKPVFLPSNEKLEKLTNENRKTKIAGVFFAI